MVLSIMLHCSVFCLLFICFGANADSVPDYLWQTSLRESYNWINSEQSRTGQYLAAVSRDDGGLYISSNFGKSWQLSSAPPDLGYVSVTINGNGSFMATLVADDKGPTNSLFISADYGKSWTNHTSALYVNWGWQSISCSDSGQYLVAVGYNLVPYVSADFGNSWSKSMSVTQTWFQGAVSSSGQYMAIVSSSSTSGENPPWVSSDYGQTFVQGTISSGRQADIFTSICVSDSGQTMWATCSVCLGGIYLSTDFGVNWIQQSTIPNVTFTDIACSSNDLTIDNSVDVVITASSFLHNQTYIYTTTDSGVTWNQTSDILQCYALSTSASGQLTLCPVVNDAVYSYTAPCPSGYQHVGFDEASGDNPCVECEKGTYDPGLTEDSCSDCPHGTYSDKPHAVGSVTCEDCLYPMWTVHSGSDKCRAVFLNVSPIIQGCLLGGALIWLGITLASGKNDNIMGSIAIFVFPVMDVSTDVAYLMSSKFYNITVFVFCIFVLLSGIFVFLWKLYRLKALPTIVGNVLWLGYSYTAEKVGTDNDFGGDYVPYPTMNSFRISLVPSMVEHESIAAVGVEIFTWIVAVIMQGATIVLTPIFLVFWFSVGALLQLTHTLAITSVWNRWFRMWTGNRNYDDIGGGFIDTSDLNYSLLFQFFCETTPQIILQIVNNTLLGAWRKDPVAIISFIVSLLNALSVVYKYAFHTCIKADRMSMVDVPLHMGFSTVKLTIRPYTKSLRKGGEVGCDTQIDEPLLALDESDSEYVSEPATSRSSHADDATTSGCGSGSNSIGSAGREGDGRVSVPRVVSDPSTIFSPPASKSSGTNRSSSVVPKSPPHEVVCALSGRVMEDAVICEDGYTYDRAAIEAHLRATGSSPITKLPLSSHTLIPNRAVMSIIRRYRDEVVQEPSA